MPRAGAALTAAAVTAAVAVTALAADTDRVQVGQPGRKVTRGFSPATFVTVRTLTDYGRTRFDGDAGNWHGPTCIYGPNPTISQRLSISWGAGFTNGVRTARAAARASLTFKWKIVEAGAVRVSHFVAGRRVGSVPGFFVVTDGRMQAGYHESGLGFTLGGRVFATVRFWSYGNVLPCSVNGEPASVWHRQQARQAIRNVALVGNLPPVRTRARSRGRRIAGTVVDRFGHPDAGIGVRLERRAGRRWRRVRTGRTNNAGRYSLRALGSGTYRVVATLAGSFARSSTVRA